jgi:hypothetical protein
MTLTGFGLKSTSARHQLKRSMQVLKPVRAKTAFLQITTIMKLASI